MMEWKRMIGKNVYVKTNSDRIITGIVDSVEYMGKDIDQIDFWIVSMTNKFGKFVSFSTKDIKFLEEQNVPLE